VHLARRPQLSDAGGVVRILDIGPRFEVDLIHRLLPKAQVDTLGLNKGLIPPRAGERNFEYDLNNTWDVSSTPTLGRYRLVVMAEVLEHLSTAPSIVLSWIATLLEPGAYLLIQTPNAVALPKRLRMLAGRHPFSPLTTDQAYPGHIREYTVAELRREGRSLGLDVVEIRTKNYFDSPKVTNKLYQRLERIVPGNLRSGITVVYGAPLRSGSK
jgi:hypothetical protein